MEQTRTLETTLVCRRTGSAGFARIPGSFRVSIFPRLDPAQKSITLTQTAIKAIIRKTSTKHWSMAMNACDMLWLVWQAGLFCDRFIFSRSSVFSPAFAFWGFRHRIHWEGKDHKQAQTAKTIYPRSTKWLADESELILCQNLFTPIVPHVITWNLDCRVSPILLLQHQWANMRKVGKGSQQNTSVTSQLPWTSVTAAISISPPSERASSSALTSFWQACLFFGNEKASSKRTLRTDWESLNRTENCSGIVVGLWI